jgi:hypothetical protein
MHTFVDDSINKFLSTLENNLVNILEKILFLNVIADSQLFNYKRQLNE